MKTLSTPEIKIRPKIKEIMSSTSVKPRCLECARWDEVSNAILDICLDFKFLFTQSTR